MIYIAIYTLFRISGTQYDLQTQSEMDQYSDLLYIGSDLDEREPNDPDYLPVTDDFISWEEPADGKVCFYDIIY